MVEQENLQKSLGKIKSLVKLILIVKYAFKVFISYKVINFHNLKTYKEMNDW